MTRAERAVQLFDEGCNCAQAVVLAFLDELPMDEAVASSVASPFGGGMGQMGEVCGAFTGACIVLGGIGGCTDPTNRRGRKELYEDVQRIAELFRADNGSLICRELLGMRERCGAPQDAPETRRTPCSHKVVSAVHALEEVLGI